MIVRSQNRNRDQISINRPALAQPPLDAAVWPEDGPSDTDLLAAAMEVDSCRDAPPAVPPPTGTSHPGQHLWGEVSPRCTVMLSDDFLCCSVCVCLRYLRFSTLTV